MDIDLKQLRELMRAIKQFDLSEIEIEKGEERVFLRRGGAGPVHVQTIPPPAAEAAPAPAAPKKAASSKKEAPKEENVVFVTSPFVGTFYRAPGPDSPAFVDVGDDIKPGKVLCIVEAMKLMNEIEAEITGTIVEILVENGKPVEYGDRLFKIQPPGSKGS